MPINDEQLINELSALRNLQPRADSVDRVRRIALTVPVQQEPQTHAGRLVPSPFTWSVLASMGTACAVFLILANQLPMHGAYVDSVAAIAHAQQVTEQFENTSDKATTVESVRRAVQSARETLDTLKLKGAFGQYSQQQCLNAYIVYDSYLDHLGEVLDASAAAAKSDAERASLEQLHAYVNDSRSEAQHRVAMYPATK